MEIKEVGEKISSSFKNGKGLWIVGGVFVGLFVISLISQSGNDDGGTTENISLQGAYVSYPDAVTNANVIIDSVQQSIDFQTEEINENFRATNDYIQQGLEANQKLTDLVENDVMGGFDDLMNNGYKKPSGGSSSSTSSASWLGDMANTITSNGNTLGQNTSLLGTKYNGQTIQGVSTNRNGNTKIETFEGSTYNVPHKDLIGLSSEQTNLTVKNETTLSNGMTMSQITNMLGKQYNGSMVTEVKTNGDGSTTLKTQDGKSYTM